MNETFDIVEFLHGIESVDLQRNIRSSQRRKQAECFLDLYSFVIKDRVFVDFMRKINGVQFGTQNFAFALYGFGFPEDELIFSLEQYLSSDGFLMLGEYVDKKITRNWKGITYAYHRTDHAPVVYAKFDRKDMPEINGRFYPLCIGFQELTEIIFHKDFDEQFLIAFTPDYPIEKD